VPILYLRGMNIERYRRIKGVMGRPSRIEMEFEGMDHRK
jgi:hypothetical protein